MGKKTDVDRQVWVVVETGKHGEVEGVRVFGDQRLALCAAMEDREASGLYPPEGEPGDEDGLVPEARLEELVLGLEVGEDLDLEVAGGRRVWVLSRREVVL